MKVAVGIDSSVVIGGETPIAFLVVGHSHPVEFRERLVAFLGLQSGLKKLPNERVVAV
jgi:hypothetical protein